jgi:hypothetical protein
MSTTPSRASLAAPPEPQLPITSVVPEAATHAGFSPPESVAHAEGRLYSMLAFNKGFVQRQEYRNFRRNHSKARRIVVVTCMDTRLTYLLPQALNVCTQRHGRNAAAVGEEVLRARQYFAGANPVSAARRSHLAATASNRSMGPHPSTHLPLPLTFRQLDVPPSVAR